MNEDTFFFYSEKKERCGAFETDEGGPEKQLTFFSLRYNIIETIGSHCGGSDER